MGHRLPWEKLVEDDLKHDCSVLSLAARGAWVWIFLNLRHYPGGERTLTLEQWAMAVVHAPVNEVRTAIAEIIEKEICDSNVTSALLVTHPSVTDNAKVTLICRRHKREDKSRYQASLRQARLRARRGSNAKNNATVTREIKSIDIDIDKDKEEEEEARESQSDSLAQSPNGLRAVPAPDETVAFFELEFKQRRRIAYGRRQGDFVQLAELRKRCGIKTRDSPPQWNQAVNNYFSSPLGKYTLADLCVRYDAFMNGRLNEFGKPEMERSAQFPTRRESVEEHNARVAEEVRKKHGG